MSEYKLGARSRLRLEGVHPDLARVVELAITKTTQDFAVVCGLRSLETQRSYLKSGASKTINSLHLKQSDGYAHAVDLVPVAEGAALWKDINGFRSVAYAMLCAADELGVLLQWGGDWNCNGRVEDESFIDMPHFQLPPAWSVEKARSAAEARKV